MKHLLFLFFLLFNFKFIYTTQLLTSIQLVDDNYSNAGNCKPIHLITVESEIEISDLYFVGGDGLIFTRSKSNYLSVSKNGLFYISVYLTTSIPVTNSQILVKGIDGSSGSQVDIDNNGLQVSYSCISPPTTLDYDSILKISKPNTIDKPLYLNVRNLLKPLQFVQVSSPSGSPYVLTFVKSEAYFIQFALSFSPSNDPIPSNNILVFTCSYDSSTFQLNLESPIKNYSSSIVKNIKQYPSSVYYSSNNWNLKNYFFFSASNVSPLLYLYFNVQGYSTQIDRNQYTTLISGNYDNGQFLSSCSLYPKKREIIFNNYPLTTYIYGDSSNKLSLVSRYFIETLPNFSPFTLNEGTSDGYYYIDYSTRFKYPDNFKFQIKIGNCNPFQFRYPYGIVSFVPGSTLEYKFSILTNNNARTPIVTLSSDVSSNYSSTSSSTSTDTTPPKLIDFSIYYPRQGDGNYAVLTAQIEDEVGGSGFSHLYYAGNYITRRDLVSGSINVYQKLIYITFGTECKIYDRAGNLLNCDSSSESNSLVNYYFDLNPPKFIPKLFNTNFEITQFYFESSSYDLSNVGRYITVYLNYSTSENDIPISFFILDRVYRDKYINRTSISNRYLRNKDLGLFRISIFLPPKLCTGTIPYLFIINGKEFTNDYFISKFGDYANLNVISNDCYELPPLFSKLNYLSSNPIILLPNVNTEVGWSFTIESSKDIKISYAYFHIISDLDKLGYKFEFTPNTVSFSSRISFVINQVDTLTQTFRIYNVTLIDERGIRSDFIDDYSYTLIMDDPTNDYAKYPPSISPLYQFLDNPVLNFTVVSTPSFANESNIPTIQFLSNTVPNTSNELESTMEISFKATDDTALSKRHIPAIYAQSFTNYGDVQINLCKFTSLLYSSDNKTLNGVVNCILPFGAENGVSISAYGIVDVNLNVAGSSILYYTTTNGSTYPSKPSIISSTPLTVFNDKLTIFGYNLPSSLNIGNAFLYYNEGESPTVLSFNYSSSVMAILNIPKSNKPFTVYTQISSSNTNSNYYKINYIVSDSSEEPVVVNCLNDCGGPTRGICIENVGCRCFAPYSGLSCMSEIIKVPKPSINETSPDSTNEIIINGTDVKLNTTVSIVALRELDIEGNALNTHYFTEWNLTKISESNYNYSSKIYKNNLYVSNIIINVQWFEEATTILFANENITINPSSLKYYISLDQYPFDSKLNSLDLIIKSVFKSSEYNDICSSKEFALNDGSDYITLKIGKFSFLGKFIKRAIINGYKVVSIENSLLNNFNNTVNQNSVSEQSSFIAVQIPNYETSVQLDPSFSVLIDSSSSSTTSNDSICSPNKSKKLTVAQIVGIVIAGIVVITLIITIIGFKLSKSLSFRILYYRLFKKNKL